MDIKISKFFSTTLFILFLAIFVYNLFFVTENFWLDKSTLIGTPYDTYSELLNPKQYLEERVNIHYASYFDVFIHPNLFLQNLSFYSLTTIIFYFLLTSLTGFFVLEKITNKKITFEFLIFSFIPGHIIMITINRLVSLFTNNEVFFFLIYLGIVLFMVITQKNTFSILFNELKNRKNILKLLLFAFVVVIISFYSLFPGEGHVVGDSFGSNYGIFDTLLSNNNLIMPIYKKQYDEILYLYPIYINLCKNNASLILLYTWLFYSFFRTALLYSFYFIFKETGLNKLHSILLSFFILAGIHTITINYHTLFDSFNPIFLSLHTGRMLSDSILLFLYFLTLNYTPKIKYKYLVPFGILLGLGISSFCITVGITVIFFFLFNFLYSTINEKLFIRELLKKSTFIAFSSLVLLFMTYYNGITNEKSICLFILILLLSLFYCINYIKCFKVEKLKKIISNKFVFSLIILVFILIGFLTLGGPFTIEFLNSKNYTLHFIPVNTYSFGVNKNISDNLFFEHFKSFSYFVKNFYFPIFLQCITLLLIATKKGYKNLLRNPKCNYTIYLSFLTFIYLLSCLFFYDFWNGNNGDEDLLQWFKSRTLEPPFYALIIFNIYNLFIIFKNTFIDRFVTSIVGINVLICLFSIKIGVVFHILLGYAMLFKHYIF